MDVVSSVLYIGVPSSQSLKWLCCQISDQNKCTDEPEAMMPLCQVSLNPGFHGHMDCCASQKRSWINIFTKDVKDLEVAILRAMKEIEAVCLFNRLCFEWIEFFCGTEGLWLQNIAVPHFGRCITSGYASRHLTSGGQGFGTEGVLKKVNYVGYRDITTMIPWWTSRWHS